jgi:vacuolar-type H+-ATPase subunit B/Vma2
VRCGSQDSVVPVRADEGTKSRTWETIDFANSLRSLAHRGASCPIFSAASRRNTCELLQRLQMLADRVGQREGIKVDLAWVQIFETGKRTLGHEGEVTSAVSRMYGRAGLPKWMPRTSLIGT